MSPRNDDMSSAGAGGGSITSDGRACICLPYRDVWMIAALVISIVAFCSDFFVLSTYMIAFLLNCGSIYSIYRATCLALITSLLAFVSVQWFWCGRTTNKCIIFTLPIMCAIAAILNLYLAWLVELPIDLCLIHAMWLTVGGLLLGFVWSGRYERLENQLKSNRNTVSSEEPQSSLPAAIPPGALESEVYPVEIYGSQEAKSDV